ncbi:MAG: glucose-6-phosphate dehydrogenase [Deltaproteobacteria bacterium]|nr:glucose-6-phosphate dehydrogenase [Deltaproteobacteria bacterium]MDQ3300098.1 glucose-6-phosphate dehydrogenase [Myxococcota bacterium]
MTQPPRYESSQGVTGEILEEVATKRRRPEPTAIVIFGATGDLGGRKLAPALFNLMLDGALTEPTVIIGVSRTPLAVEQFAEHLRPRLAEFSRQPVEPAAWDKFASSLDYVGGDFANDATYVALKVRLEAAKAAGTRGNRVFYLATPPSVFAVILEKLQKHGLIERAVQKRGVLGCRVIVEKPFGRDLASARALNEMIGNYLHETQIYRIDHYLGKETVQNILVLRFGNSIFEPLWNRNHISHVEITAAETIGIEGRGTFYEQTGVVRDIIQNHLLQVMSLVTMEVPASFSADDIRDEKSQVLRSVRNLSLNDVANYAVRGQYRGYRDEHGVAPESETATYAALRLMIDSWRWHGVPFYLRAGKKLAERLTEVQIHFKSVPLVLFKDEAAGNVLQPAVLTLRIQPSEGISLRFVAKVPGESINVGNVHMTMTYADAFKRPISEAYERLLLDCMRGDATLFNRRDSVDRAWELIQPILQVWEATPGVTIYEPGGCGPADADTMMTRDGCSWRTLVAE